MRKKIIKTIVNQKGAIMNQKRHYLTFALFLLLACLFLTPARNTQAAVKQTGILNGSSKKSCQLDLDGDGVKEKLKLSIKYDEYGCIAKAVFYVNGKKALMLNKPSWVFSIEADYIKMSDSNIFIRCHTTGDNDATGSDCIYRYDTGKKNLVKETRLFDINENCSGATLKKVTASEVNIQYYQQLETIGRITWTGKYVIRDGRLKLKPAAYKVNTTMTAEYGDPDGYGKLLEKINTKPYGIYSCTQTPL